MQDKNFVNDNLDEEKRIEYNIFLTGQDVKKKLNIGHCFTLTSLLIDWFDRIDDQFADYPYYNDADEETIVRMYFIFYGHGLYEIKKDNDTIYSKLI